MSGGFSVARESDGVNVDSFIFKFIESSLHFSENLLFGWQFLVIFTILVPSTFAVDTVETTEFAI